MARLKLRAAWQKYRYVLLVAAAGLVLMLLPGGESTPAPDPIPTEAVQDSLERRLEQILSRIEGAGEVAVLLTEARGGEVFYQTEGEDGKTVLVTGSDRSQSGLVRTTMPASYLGAVVVCRGADSPAVRLEIVNAVAKATGLGTDRITVLKME